MFKTLQNTMFRELAVLPSSCKDALNLVDPSARAVLRLLSK
jgi:hypothetical protein